MHPDRDGTGGSDRTNSTHSEQPDSADSQHSSTGAIAGLLERVRSLRPRLVGSITDRAVPPWNLRGDARPQYGADSELARRLAEGSADEFDRVRETAVRTLRETEARAVWLQAVGDGPPFDDAPTTSIERPPRVRPALVTGFDDSLGSSWVDEVLTHMAAHQIGLRIDPTADPDPADRIAEEFVTEVRETAADVYGDPAGTDRRSLVAGPLADGVDRAVDLLSAGGLSGFLVQVVPETPLLHDATDRSLARMPSCPIEYAHGMRSGLDERRQRELLTALQVQNLAVAAGITDASLDRTAEVCLGLLRDRKYVHAGTDSGPAWC